MVKERKWILKESADSEVVSRLSSELGIDPVLAGLLAQRAASTHSRKPGRFSVLTFRTSMIPS